jgi:hypothetical protein
MRRAMRVSPRRIFRPVFAFRSARFVIGSRGKTEPDWPRALYLTVIARDPEASAAGAAVGIGGLTH